MTRKPYAQWEIGVINCLYPDKKALAARLPNRPPGAVLAKARALGMGKPRAPDWTLKEQKTVARLYPDCAAIQRALPGRTLSAIQSRIRDLKLSKGRKRWSEDRVSVLRKLAGKVPDVAIAEIMGTTPGAVAFQRKTRGFTAKPKRDAKRSTLPLIQDIRDEAGRRGLSIHRLTRHLGCCPVSPSNTDSKVSWPSAVCVVHALGGELYAEWDD